MSGKETLQRAMRASFPSPFPPGFAVRAPSLSPVGRGHLGQRYAVTFPFWSSV
ncbi:hypothetical protein EV283_1590 [Sphingomonas sp. BK036]|nr:hypothetical protein EV283_1590 [Sphingomonas sp. BK036]